MTFLVVAAAIFTFQNNFWVNLHQFLHAEAARKAAGRAIQLDAELVEGYAEMAKRDLLRDEGLVAINDALSRVPWLDGRVPFEEALRNLVRDVSR